MLRNAFACLICFFAFFHLNAQQTVGLFNLDSAATPGFTLFAPMAYTEVFLIDNCGREVNRWSSTRTPGVSVYLMDNGNLVRPLADTSATFTAGGAGGWLEMQDWDGNLLWEYDFGGPLIFQHHDIEPLPNGNILVMAWDKKDFGQVLAQGRDSAITNSGGLWAERITELRPIFPDSAEIVWEWSMWDHIIQDFAPGKPNFGVVEQHPELMDLNWEILNGGSPDWLHFNGMDYDPIKDQIVISVLHTDEVWVIDHSTTTAEAASHNGGLWGKGGDILYRWGNPMAYKSGTLADQRLFGQHDTRWIPQGYPNAGNISIFNNGAGRPSGNISSVDIIEPPTDSTGAYVLAGQTYGPDSAYWSYTAPVPTDFYSSFISGAYPLPNGNFMVCEGDEGILFEIDSTGREVWRYVNPVTGAGPLPQGSYPGGNIVFRVQKYLPAYGAFNGRTLTAGNQIEQNPLPLPPNCPPIVAVEEPEQPLRIFPNPTNEWLVIQRNESREQPYQLTDLNGRQLKTGVLNSYELRIPMQDVSPGIYLLQVGEAAFKVVRSQN